jgi:hypothetical protein
MFLVVLQVMHSSFDTCQSTRYLVARHHRLGSAASALSHMGHDQMLGRTFLPDQSSAYPHDAMTHIKLLIVCPPSNTSPFSSFCQPCTAPTSTQTICLYPSSGEKSPMALAFSIHGFHTTVSCRLSRTTSKRGAPSSTTEVVSCGIFA